ncbi:hypothetical protein AMB3_3686 [plant metagenome]
MTARPLMLTALLVALSTAAQARDLDIYLSPSGNDRNDGAAPAQAVKTLNRVRTRLAEQAGKGKEYARINVNFLPGTYQGLSVTWSDVDLRGTPVYFRPAPEAPGKVVIDGEGGKFTRFFTLRETRGDVDRRVPTRLHFENLTVRNYCEAISLGDGLSKSILVGNRITGNTFENIGSKFDPVSRERDARLLRNGACTAAIRIQRSAQNQIHGNTFRNIENLPKEETFRRRYGPTYLHAIYIAHHASDNDITGNTFERFTGSPIRVRNQSDNIRIEDNVFSSPLYVEDEESRQRGARVMRAVSQWYCGHGLKACAEGDVVHRPECPSTGLTLNRNTVQGKIELYANLSERSRATCPAGPENARRFEPANQVRMERNTTR